MATIAAARAASDALSPSLRSRLSQAYSASGGERGNFKSRAYVAMCAEGCTPLGSGAFGVAAAVPGGAFVVKAYAEDPAYRAFLNVVADEAKDGNPHVPTIHERLDIGDNSGVVVMERLTPLAQNSEPSPIASTFWSAKELLAEACGEEDWQVRPSTIPTVELPGALRVLMWRLALAIGEGGHFRDLHRGNAMERDGVLVITDPMASS